MSFVQTFVKRWVNIRIGDEIVVDNFVLRYDCFFRLWNIKELEVSDEGMFTGKAINPEKGGSPAQVTLTIDPIDGLLIEYRFMEWGRERVFALSGIEYKEEALWRLNVNV